MKRCSCLLVACLLVFVFSQVTFAQEVMIGPRLTGNLNIYNQKGLVGTYNGVGIGIGGTVDMMFNKSVGMMVNLTAFDMKNFSNSTTNGNTTTDFSYSLSYLTLDPMFKAEFSGFYMVGGGSLGIKINSSGEQTTTQTGAAPATQSIALDTKSVRFDFAIGTGYNFVLTPGKMELGTDIMAYIPITDTFNFPGLSNSIFTIKLGAALKFKI